ncbi:MAG: hypothetical protein ACI9EZ_002185, partial [Halobacteriales archaeon]
AYVFRTGARGSRLSGLWILGMNPVHVSEADYRKGRLSG